MDRIGTKKKEEKKITNVVFLLDQTGSMMEIKDDTIGGFNSFLDEQQKSGNEINFWLTLFNSTKIDKKYIKESIKNVEPLNDSTYVPTNGTPLWDAVGNTMQEFSDEKDVMFIILTDGRENSSIEFKAETVNKMIKEKEKDFNWKFLYLGVGIKNFEDAIVMGIGMSFGNSGGGGGIRGMSDSLSRSVSSYVKTGKVTYEEEGSKKNK